MAMATLDFLFTNDFLNIRNNIFAPVENN